MVGYIKLFRSVQQHWVWEDKPFSKGQAWIDLLMFVYRFDSKEPIQGQIQVTKAGSRWTGYRELGERWGWSSGKVRRFLKLLESDGMVNIKCNTNGTLVTIVKYGDFQIERNTDDTQTTRKRNTNDTRTNTEKKDNKVNKVEKVNIASGGPLDSDDEEISDEEYIRMMEEGEL